MPKYDVSVTVEIEKNYIIEAEDEYEAREIAEDAAWQDNYGNNSVDAVTAWNIDIC